MEEQKFAELEGALEKSEKALLEQVKKQNEEIAKHGATTAETSKAIEDAEKRLDQVMADVKGLNGEIKTEIKSALDPLTERLAEIEKASQRPGWDNGGDEEKSPGEIFVGSEALKKARAAGRVDTDPVHVKQLISKSSFLSSAATRLVMPQRTDAVSPALRRLRIRDLLPVRPTTSNAIEYLEETGFAATGAASGTQTHGAAAPTSEGSQLPEAQLEMTLQTANVREIGHWIPASRQVLDDADQMRAYIDDRLLYGVLYREEVQLLYGDGTSPNLQGFMTHSSNQDYAWSSGSTTPVADTKIDALRRAATLAHVAEYTPTGAVVNPNDWEDIQLAKDTQGQYLWLIVANGTEERLFRMPVVVTTAITSGDALVGAFAMGATLWDREQANIRVSESHGNFFTEGLVAIRGSERVALTIYRPDAFVNVDFDAAPS